MRYLCVFAKVSFIFNTSVKPRRLLRPDKVGENLKVLLGKRAGRTYISIEEYCEAVPRL